MNEGVEGGFSSAVFTIFSFSLASSLYLSGVRPASILPIHLEDLLDPERLEEIYRQPETIYWTTDWSPRAYIAFAKAGFIATSTFHPELGHLLLPEIQSSYATLDWKDLHQERSMLRWQRSAEFADQNYRLVQNHDFEAIIRGLDGTHGRRNWLRGNYVALLQGLFATTDLDDFQLTTTGLLARDGDLVAGEIGYQIDRVYTSLTGFFDRTNPSDNHAGKLQLHLLAKELQKASFAFWNLGHPEMPYKTQLGAKTVSRADFLRRWPKASSS